MSTINAQIVAARLRVAKNFMMLVNAGIDSNVAASIVRKYRNLSFGDVRIADDKVVICYNTCTTKHSINYTLVA